MKHLTALLQKGNLTPKERYLLLIQNDIIKARTGKETLTEADKHALQNWQAGTKREADEWNKYNDGWKLSGKLEIESAIIHMQTQSDHFRKFTINLQLNFYPLHRQERLLLQRLERIKTVDNKEAEAIIRKQREQKLKDGIDFEYAVYQLAFESLSKEDQEKFIDLYPDVASDHSYLDQEEIIADLFDGKDELTGESKKKLAELVAGKSYNAYAKEYQLFHYFACIPLAEVARQFLTDKGVTIKGKPLAKNQEMDDGDDTTHDDIQKAIEKYAKDNNVTVEILLAESCLKWLDRDLLEQYTPLVTSNARELFDRWIATKTEAKKILEKLVVSGKLKIRERTAEEIGLDTYGNERHKQELEKRILSKEQDNRIITGESLYHFKGNYEFIKDFKDLADRYDANLGIVYADNDPQHIGEHEDQELLVSSKNMDGELNMFSMFGFTLQRLKGVFEATQFIEEMVQDGEIVLDFSSDTFKTIFVQTRESLITGYAKLLAFREIFRRLSKLYETDMCYFQDQWVENIGDYIDQHNSALRTATEQELKEDDPEQHLETWVNKRKNVMRMKDDYFIDKDKIEPDADIIREHTDKFRDIFGSDY